MRGLARGIPGDCGAPYPYTASASCVSMRPDDFGQNHMVGSGHLRAAAVTATAELEFEDVVAWHTLLTHGCVARYEAAARKVSSSVDSRTRREEDVRPVASVEPTC